MPMEAGRSRDEEEGIDSFYLRSMLQGALLEGIIKEWHGPTASGGYIIKPSLGESRLRSKEYVIGFCELLAITGVEQDFEGIDP